MYPVDFFHRAAAYRPERVAVVDVGVSLTYGQLKRQADALGAALQALSGKERLKVALLCPNSMDLFLSLVALHTIAAVLIPLNPRNARAELQAQMDSVEPDVLIADLQCLELVQPGPAKLVLAGVDAHTELVTVRQLVEKFQDRTPAWPAVAPTDEYAIKFTGGSSGRPKGVLQSFRSHCAVIVNVLLGLRFADGEVYVCAAPMTHGAGSFLLPTLAVGGKVVIAHGTKADALLDTIEHAAGTATWVPPTLLYLLIEEQKARPRALAQLRHLIFGGAPAAPEKIEEALRVFGNVLESSFGQTEASTIATALCAADLADPRSRCSAGRAGALSRVAIMDAQGRLQPPGATGEIVVGGDLLMNGYLGMPEETARTLVDGWLHTGDVGYLDERGFLFVKDRIRDVVITGGFNVYPSDVEAALTRHAAVHECVVFGMPDPHWGERVEAAVELKPQAQATAEELIEFARQQVGSVKAPKRIHLLPALPRSPVGKVLRREAKARLLQQPPSESAPQA